MPGLLGLHVADLPTAGLQPGQVVNFVCDAWPGREWAVTVVEAEA